MKLKHVLFHLGCITDVQKVPREKTVLLVRLSVQLPQGISGFASSAEVQ